MKNKPFLNNKALSKIVRDAFVSTIRNTQLANSDTTLDKEIALIEDIIRTYPTISMSGSGFTKRMEKLDKESAFTMLLLSDMYLTTVTYGDSYSTGISDFFRTYEERLIKMAESVSSKSNINFLKNIQVKACEEFHFSQVKNPSVNMCILLSLFLDIDNLAQYFNPKNITNQKRKDISNDKSQSEHRK